MNTRKKYIFLQVLSLLILLSLVIVRGFLAYINGLDINSLFPDLFDNIWFMYKYIIILVDITIIIDLIAIVINFLLLRKSIQDS